MTSKAVALISVAAIALTSCVQLGEDQDAAYGYLTIEGFDVDVRVGQLVPTKADGTVDISKVKGYSVPGFSSVTVTSKNDASKTYTWSGEELKLPAGAYTLSAISGVNGFEAPYFVGNGDVTVKALERVSGEVAFTLGNSVMKVTMAAGFDDHFSPVGDTPVTISGSYGNVAAAMDTYVFVPSGEQLTVKIEGKSSAGVKKDYTVNVTPSAATAYDVVLSAGGVSLPAITLSDQQVAWGDRIFITAPAGFTGSISEANKATLVYEAIPATSSDWSNPMRASEGVIKGLTSGVGYKVRARVGNLTSAVISLTPSVSGLSSSATHTKTGDDLDGTDVTTTFTSPAQVVTDAISGWAFQLYKSDGTTLLREYTDTDGSITSDGSSITATNGWPYLPQGDYNLKATVTLKDGSKVSSMEPIKVPAPEFGVSVSGKTSYSYYTSGDAATANAKNAETVYEISSSAKISENILKNSNYAKPTVTYSVGGKQVSGTYSASKSHSQGEISGLTWGSHTMTATVNFDNTPCSGTCECVITGLPYSVSFYNITSAPFGWTFGGDVSWKGYSWNIGDGAKYLRLKGASSYSDRGRAISPKFNVPNNINVQTTLDCMHYESSGEKQTIYVNANTSSCPELTTNGTSINHSVLFDNFDNVADVENKMTLTSSKPHITITHNIPREGVATRFFGVKSLKIIYN